MATPLQPQSTPPTKTPQKNPPPKSWGPTAWPPLFFLVYQSIVLVVLVLGMLVFTGLRVGPFKDFTIPDFTWDEVLPLWVPYAGALGGTTISLVGVVQHGHEWDGPGYAYWHLARPALGMITGSVAVLVLLFVLKGVAPEVIPAAGTSYSAGGVAALFVISFVIGYREETFRQLVKRVVDVILGPGDQAATQRLSLTPPVLPLQFDPAAGLTEVAGSVTLLNDTKDTFDIASADIFSSHSQFAVKWADEAPLAPGQLRGLNVLWTPGIDPQSADTTITVRLGGYRLTSTIRGTVL